MTTTPREARTASAPTATISSSLRSGGEDRFFGRESPLGGDQWSEHRPTSSLSTTTSKGGKQAEHQNHHHSFRSVVTQARINAALTLSAIRRLPFAPALATSSTQHAVAGRNRGGDGAGAVLWHRGQRVAVYLRRQRLSGWLEYVGPRFSLSEVIPPSYRPQRSGGASDDPPPAVCVSPGGTSIGQRSSSRGPAAPRPPPAPPISARVSASSLHLDVHLSWIDAAMEQTITGGKSGCGGHGAAKSSTLSVSAASTTTTERSGVVAVVSFEGEEERSPQTRWVIVPLEWVRPY